MERSLCFEFLSVAIGNAPSPALTAHISTANTTNEPNDTENKTQVPTPTHAAVSDEDVKGESDSPAAAGNEADQATAEGTEADPASDQAETATNGGEKRPREESACGESDTAAAEGSAVEQDSEAQPSSAKKQNTSAEQE